MNKEFNTKQKIKIEKLMNKQKFKQSSRKIVENKDTNNNVQRKIVSALSSPPRGRTSISIVRTRRTNPLESSKGSSSDSSQYRLPSRVCSSELASSSCMRPGLFSSVVAAVRARFAFPYMRMSRIVEVIRNSACRAAGWPSRFAGLLLLASCRARAWPR